MPKPLKCCPTAWREARGRKREKLHCSREESKWWSWWKLWWCSDGVMYALSGFTHLPMRERFFLQHLTQLFISLHTVVSLFLPNRYTCFSILSCTQTILLPGFFIWMLTYLLANLHIFVVPNFFLPTYFIPFFFLLTHLSPIIPLLSSLFFPAQSLLRILLTCKWTPCIVW